MADLVAAIEAAAPGLAGAVPFDGVQLPFPPELEAGALAGVLGFPPSTPLEAGVRKTIEHFRARG